MASFFLVHAAATHHATTPTAAAAAFHFAELVSMSIFASEMNLIGLIDFVLLLLVTGIRSAGLMNYYIFNECR